MSKRKIDTPGEQSPMLTADELVLFRQLYAELFQKVGAQRLSLADAELALVLMPTALRWEILGRIRTQIEDPNAT